MTTSSRLLPLLLGLIVLGSGCSEEIVSPPDLPAFYTLWGSFDPTAELQAVRVVPITDTVSIGSAAALPVVVTSRDLASGENRTWRDSVISLGGDAFAHIYISDFQPSYGSQHVFTIASEDGTETSALVRVPALIEPIRQTPDTGFGVTYPYLWVDAPQLNRVRAIYTVETAACNVSDIELPLLPGSAIPTEFGWSTRLRLRDEGAEVLTRYARQTGYEGTLTLNRVTLIAEVASGDWRPQGGAFDPELLVEPGTLSNVTNGFGFIGSAYEVRLMWEPTREELQRTTFRSEGFDCPEDP